MKSFILKKPALLLTALMVLTVSAWALDLPVRSVNGRQFYYYKVKKGESLYGISKQLNIPVDRIVAENPAYADGVKKGDLLVFPYDDFSEDVIDDDNYAVADTVEVIEEAVGPQAPVIGIMLPFGTALTERSRRNNVALDFYRGVLIAADSLSSRPGDVQLAVRDTEGLNADAIRNLIAGDSLLSIAQVIIAPDDDEAIAAIAAATADRGTYVLNVFNTRDSSYSTTPRLMQANVPQTRMYSLAVDAIMADYPGYTPVILRNASGGNNREAFTSYLSSRYLAEGIEPIVIEYKTSLVNADLESLTTEGEPHYLIIPGDGSVAEFNRFAYVLRSFRDRVNGENPGVRDAVKVFGYPDWTAFRGDALEMLHRLEVSVYSRFYDDFNGFSARILNDDFKNWYGTKMMESVPVYGILGYDTASYVIRNLRGHNGKFDPVSVLPYSGIQSTFDFISSGEGYVNNALYIITYGANGRLSARVQ